LGVLEQRGHCYTLQVGAALVSSVTQGALMLGFIEGMRRLASPAAAKEWGDPRTWYRLSDQTQPRFVHERGGLESPVECFARHFGRCRIALLFGADFPRICALVAPWHPPRRAHNPFAVLFSKQALGELSPQRR